MARRNPGGPLPVGPSPQVLKAIRSAVKKSGLGPLDRRLPSVAARLAIELPGRHGWNEGIFYPPDALPARAAALGVSPGSAARSRPTTGTIRCLVLLVDFKDNKGTRDPAEFKDMLLSTGTYPTGSMYDFYKENSYGKLDLKGEVVGWLRLPQPYSYYVNGNNGGGDYPTNAQKMVEDALTLAVKKVNLKDFDDDKDGYLDGLFVVHAGGGAEAEPDAAARAKKIWSHQWSLPKPFVQNGVRVFAYCTEPEDGRAGVFCHEFGHMLGLPDLYDTTYQSEGVGVWCLMAAGSWNNGGQTPAQFCAWAKTRLGWIRPAIVRKNQSLKLAAIEDDPKAVYRIWNKGRSGAEYFLVENRQLRGFDAKLPASGLLVWHVDDTQHNNDHAGKYWVALEQADGKNDLETGRNRGDKGDPYPGDAGNTKFDGKSAPSSSDNLNRPTGVSISGVTVDKGVVKCRVNV